MIPVYNEEAVLPTLFARLYPALDALKIPYEIVFVNDGSKDRRSRCCASSSQLRPQETRVVLFHANFGQHSAVMAGLAYARGEYVVTLDADLQNPPEEIGKLVAKLDEGYDYVGTIRQQRQDSLWRRWLLQGHQQDSRMDHAGAHHRPGLHDARLCALRGDGAQSNARGQYLHSGAGVLVRHEAHRGADRPRGTLRRALEIFDVQLDPPEFRFDHRLFRGAAAAVFHDRHAGRAACPRCCSWCSSCAASSSAPRPKGLFTLFSVVFLFIGLALFGIGLLGEYVGRIYAQVRERPRYIVEAVLEESDGAPVLERGCTRRRMSRWRGHRVCRQRPG